MTDEPKVHKLLYIGGQEEAFRLKAQAAELKFPSLADYLRAISLLPTRKIKELLK